jgi:hypothetical protein
MTRLHPRSRYDIVSPARELVVGLFCLALPWFSIEDSSSEALPVSCRCCVKYGHWYKTILAEHSASQFSSNVEVAEWSIDCLRVKCECVL